MSTPTIDLSTLRMPTVKGLASWYGSNRMLAVNVGVELSRSTHVTVPFAGSMTELLHITARSLVVADVHRHLINLARVVADRQLCAALYRRLRRLPFHPEVLAQAQFRCLTIDADAAIKADPLAWAEDYFVCSWMGQGGRSGTKSEFSGKLSVRFDAGGGDSNRRFRSAAHSLLRWNLFARDRCTFEVDDFRKVLDKGEDKPKRGVYCDPPFVKEGGGYRHAFSIEDHRDLSRRLNAFKHVRCVVRYYDHDLVRELYPEGRWTYRTFNGRNQNNKTGRPELLIINGASIAPGGAATIAPAEADDDTQGRSDDQ